MFVALHKGPAALEQAKRDCDAEMAVIGPRGARHAVILPEGYTDLDGSSRRPPRCRTTSGRPTDRHERAGPVPRRRARRGARVPHPRRQPRRAPRRRSSASWTARTRRPCAVPGHRARRLLRRGQPRAHRATTPTASATSTSSRSTRRSAPGSREERLGFAPAVRLGAMVEPPLGEPDMARVLEALGRRSTGTCSASSSRTCTPATVPLPSRTHDRHLRTRGPTSRRCARRR